MIIHAHEGDCRWEGIEVLHYKQDGGTTFHDVTRQVLFDEQDIAFQWRYFEVASGGYSSLERHEHAHAVMIVRGRGRVFLGDCVHDIGMYDLVYVPPLTWHQFQPSGDEPLGFLCIVNSERDRPQLPSPEQMAELRAMPAVAEFIKA
jgi:mannose-6-phosphate isomerase-like protein (cupin superfamily)